MQHKINYYIGRLAEMWASLFLRCKGYKIVSRNYRCRFGEIDIIACKYNDFVFVEVKKRRTKELAIFSLQKSQQMKIKKAANYYLACNQTANYSNINLRFDLIVVDSWLRLEHSKNHW